jgi:ABC-type phosphate transport system auxiliary subunit
MTEELELLYIKLSELEAEYQYIVRDNKKGDLKDLMHRLEVIRNKISKLEERE